jgi:hypothetical protein
MTVNEAETLTPSAMQWFTSLAQDAERDLKNLPESSQPIWFRTEIHHSYGVA